MKSDIGRIKIILIPRYENAKKINKGIENALVLDGVDITDYYVTRTSIGDYGEEKIIQEFDKMACCDAICSMSKEKLLIIFTNLKVALDQLTSLYNN